MTDLEVMQRAKKYISYLANGVDPLSGEPIPENDIVNNVRISRCLNYVSEILQQVIDNGGKVKKEKIPRSKRQAFNLTEAQRSSLKTYRNSVSLSKFVGEINSVIDSNTMKKLKATHVSEWLTQAGILKALEYAEGKYRRIPTEQGEELGLSISHITDDRGIQEYVVYDKNAQQFILDNLDAIIVFAEQEENRRAEERRKKKRNVDISVSEE